MTESSEELIKSYKHLFAILVDLLTTLFLTIFENEKAFTNDDIGNSMLLLCVLDFILKNMLVFFNFDNVVNREIDLWQCANRPTKVNSLLRNMNDPLSTGIFVL